MKGGERFRYRRRRRSRNLRCRRSRLPPLQRTQGRGTHGIVAPARSKARATRPRKVLDTADIVRDGDVTPTTTETDGRGVRCLRLEWMPNGFPAQPQGLVIPAEID